MAEDAENDAVGPSSAGGQTRRFLNGLGSTRKWTTDPGWSEYSTLASLVRGTRPGGLWTVRKRKSKKPEKRMERWHRSYASLEGQLISTEAVIDERPKAAGLVRAPRMLRGREKSLDPSMQRQTGRPRSDRRERASFWETNCNATRQSTRDAMQPAVLSFPRFVAAGVVVP